MIESITLGSLVLNGTDSSGVLWGADTLQGWGSPASTITPVQKPRQTGAWGGLAYGKARSVVISGQTVAPTRALLSAAVDELVSAADLLGTTLTVVESGLSRTLTVRRDGEVALTVKPGVDLMSWWSIQLVAVDPRKMGAALTASTSLPCSSGGLSWPLSWPLTWPAVSVTGQVSLTNPGNASGPVLLEINGPITGPTITHVSAGQALIFSSSLTLGAGEFITVDMERREVLAQGQAAASRNAWVTGRGWSSFDPGVNTWAFSAPSYDTGTLQVTATPAWQ